MIDDRVFKVLKDHDVKREREREREEKVTDCGKYWEILLHEI